MNNNKTFAQAVFQISDLVKLIGSYKKEIENNDNKKNMLIELMDFMRYNDLDNNNGFFKNGDVNYGDNYEDIMENNVNFIKVKFSDYKEERNEINYLFHQNYNNYLYSLTDDYQDNLFAKNDSDDDEYYI